MKKRIFALLLAVVLLIPSMASAREYWNFEIKYTQKTGAKVNDTAIKIYASADGDSTLVDRTSEFTLDGLKWLKYVNEIEPGKTIEDYDWVDTNGNVYATICNDKDVFDKNYSYILQIDSLHADQEDTFHRSLKINGVDIDELGGSCYNSGWDFFVRTKVREDKPWEDASSWAEDELETAEELGLIPDCLYDENLTKPITRKEFAAVSVKVYEALSNKEAKPVANNPFVDTNDEEVLKAFNIGVTTGISETEFAPDVLLNREQAATMLARVYKNIANVTTLDISGAAKFADDKNISDWAKESVYFMAFNGIIKGMDGNKFAPKNVTTKEEATGFANATREQALLIAVRMVENLK